MPFADHIAKADRLVVSLLNGGESISYMPRSGPYVGESVDLTGKAMFTDAYRVADLGDAGVSVSAPELWAKAADLPGSGDELRDFDEDDPLITVNGQTYTSRERRRDGVGGFTFVLLEVR